MSVLTFNIFDERVTDVSLPLIRVPGEKTPFHFEDNQAPKWAECIPENSVTWMHRERQKWTEMIAGDGAEEPDGGWKCSMRYFTSLSQIIQCILSQPPPPPPKEQGVVKQQFEDPLTAVKAWADRELIAVVYNMGLIKAKAATALRLTVNYTEGNNSVIVEGDRKIVGDIQHVQSAFEEAAGLFDYLLTLTSNSRKVVTYPEVDTPWVRSLMFACLGCAQESLWLYHVLQNKDGRLCGLLASSIGHFFAQMHQMLTAVPIIADLEQEAHTWSNSVSVKKNFYNGVAHFFFNANSPKRRTRSLDLLQICLQDLVQADPKLYQATMRRSATDEVCSYITEVTNWKADRKVSSRFKGCEIVDIDDSAIPYSKAKPQPRLPRIIKAARMYLHWKQWTELSLEGKINTEEVLQSTGDPLLDFEREEARKAEEESETAALARRAEQQRKKRAKMGSKVSQSPGETRMKLSVHMNAKDARTGETREEDDILCHEVSGLIEVSAPPVPKGCSGTCLMLIVDSTGEFNLTSYGKIIPTKGAVQEALKDLFGKLNLTNNDYIGVVTFSAGEAPKVTVTSADQNGLVDIGAALDGTRRKCGNTAVVEGVLQALSFIVGAEERRHPVSKCSAFELLIFTDGEDTHDFRTGSSNWLNFHSMMDQIKQSNRFGSTCPIRLHGFAIGGQSDRYLVESIARMGGGDYYETESDSNGLSIIRSWFVKHIADQFHKASTNVFLDLNCCPGVTVTQVGTDSVGCSFVHAAPSHFNAPPDSIDNSRFSYDIKALVESGQSVSQEYISTQPVKGGDVHPLHDWLMYENRFCEKRVYASKVRIALEEFSSLNKTVIPFAVRVAYPNIQRLRTPLLNVTLTYRDASKAQVETAHQLVTLPGVPTLLDKQAHGWLKQMYVESTEQYIVVTSNDTTVIRTKRTQQLLAGQWLYLKDRVTLTNKTCYCSVRTVDQCLLRFYNECEFEISESDSDDNQHRITLIQGNNGGSSLRRASAAPGAALGPRVMIQTTPGAVLYFDASPYTIRVSPSTKAMIEWGSGCVRCSCLAGRLVLTHPAGQVMIPSLRETRAGGGGAPSTPFLMPDVSFSQWMKADITLVSQVVLEGEVNRLVAAQCFLKSAELLRKSWLLNEKVCNYRCRGFLIKYWLKEANNRFTNSVAHNAYHANEAAKRKIEDKKREEEEQANMRKKMAMGDSPANVEVQGPSQFVLDAPTLKNILQLGMDKAGTGLPRDKSIPIFLEDNAISLIRQRPRGMSDLYVSTHQLEFLSAHEDNKAAEQRAKRVDERHRNAAEAMQTSSDIQRKVDIVSNQLHDLFDLDASGLVELFEFQQVILPLSVQYNTKYMTLHPAAGQLGSAKLQLQACVTMFLSRWEQLVEEDILPLKMDRQQLSLLFIFLTEPMDSDEFDRLIEVIKATLTPLRELNTSTRRGKALWNLFQIWDKMKVGFIDMEEMVELVSNCTQGPGMAMPLFRGTPQYLEFLDFMKTPLSELTQNSRDDDDALTQVFLKRFHEAFNVLMRSCDETEFHNAIWMIRHQLECRTIDHMDRSKALSTQHMEEERDRMIAWDLRHCFNGVTRRNLEKLLSGVPAPPADIQVVCRPICILLSLSPKGDLGIRDTGVLFGTVNEQRYEDWFGTLKELLGKDMKQLTTFMKEFPLLSVSYKDYQIVYTEATGKNVSLFQPSAWMQFNPIIACMVDWVRIVMKLLELDRGWKPETDEQRAERVKLHGKVFQVSRDENVRKLVRVPRRYVEGEPDPLAPVTAEEKQNLLANLGVGRLAIGRVHLSLPTASLSLFHSPEYSRVRRKGTDGSPTKELDDFEPNRVSTADTSLLRLATPPMRSSLNSPFNSTDLSTQSPQSNRSASLWPRSNSAISPRRLNNIQAAISMSAARGSGFAAVKSPRRQQPQEFSADLSGPIAPSPPPKQEAAFSWHQ